MVNHLCDLHFKDSEMKSINSILKSIGMIDHEVISEVRHGATHK